MTSFITHEEDKINLGWTFIRALIMIQIQFSSFAIEIWNKGV